MKVHNSVKLELSREELDAVQFVYNMLYEISPNEEKAVDCCISVGVSIEDVRGILFDIWELSGHDTDEL